MQPPPHRQGPFNRLICWITIFFFFLTPIEGVLAAQQKDRTRIKKQPGENNSSALSQSEQCLREQLRKFLGIPYRLGGSTRRGMDCSGLTKCIYSQFLGIDLPHNSAAQSRLDELEDISPMDDGLKTGDLLFFGARKRGITHVGIYMSDGKFIHANRRSGVNISSLSQSYWKNRFVSSKRARNSGTSSLSDNLGLSGMRELLALSGDSRFDRSLQSLEMGYSSPLLSSINLNVDTFVNMTPQSNDHYKTRMNLRGLDQRIEETMPDLDARQGVRVFTDMTPFNWLTITPSFTRISERGLYKNQDYMPLHILGLDTVLKPKASRWSIAMSARTWNQKDDYYWPSGMSQDVNSYEVGIGLGLNLTSSSRFSLMGMGRFRDYDEMQYLSDNDSRMSPFISNIAFKLDFAF
ncbi:conserved hypothetical protein [uncultured Desulfobacterium sp.]|uniref:NlpC/P60 domain-containing protein n=1 Tax=uncultured Desulfobacterium sp. TaxID=201089 RepID=A0A445N379_9BACT|nr:conserved hypothetical protein [uncultured Desulfobacterium sp.]